MTNSKTLYDNLIRDLKLNEPVDEIQAIAFEVLDHLGISRTDVLTQKESIVEYNQLIPIINRLNKNEPVQYILGEAWFCGHKFLVNSSVLIPRPETELLIEEAVKIIDEQKSISILDIGTGSGCIAITLALMFPRAKVSAIDISDDALEVAKENAKRLGANVHFFHHDILTQPLTESYDVIVSNPPYIADQEKPTISKNVIDYEPHVALFAHETDALVFYKAINKAISPPHSLPGKIILEINPIYSQNIIGLFRELYPIQHNLIKDLEGKNRFLIGIR